MESRYGGWKEKGRGEVYISFIKSKATVELFDLESDLFYFNISQPFLCGYKYENLI